VFTRWRLHKRPRPRLPALAGSCGSTLAYCVSGGRCWLRWWSWPRSGNGRLDNAPARIFQATCSIIIENNAPQVLEGVKDVVEMGSGGWMYREFSQTQFRIHSFAGKRAKGHRPSGPGTRSGFGQTADGKVQVSRQDVNFPAAWESESRRGEGFPHRHHHGQRHGSRGGRRGLPMPLPTATSKGILTTNSRARAQPVPWLGEQTVDLRKRLETSELELLQVQERAQPAGPRPRRQAGMTRQNLQALNQESWRT